MVTHSSRLFMTLSPFVLAAGLVACEGEGGVEKSAALYEGIYRVDRLTENSSSCDVEGPSTVAGDRDHMVVFSGDDIFSAWIQADGCADPTDCRQRLADKRAQRGTSVTFSYSVREDKGDHLEGVLISSGFTGNNSLTCTNAESTAILMRQTSPDTARIEARSIVVDHPKNEDGFCTTAATETAAAGQPCSLLRVVEATRIEAL